MNGAASRSPGVGCRALSCDLATVARLREGEYTAHSGQRVYVQDHETPRDVLDLYAVVKESDESTGSPNLENQQALDLVTSIQQGLMLSSVQIGTLLGLMEKHRAEIGALRDSGYGSGQDYMAAPNPETARLIDHQEDSDT